MRYSLSLQRTIHYDYSTTLQLCHSVTLPLSNFRTLYLRMRPALLFVRCFAFSLTWIGGLWLLRNLLVSYDSFNPSYTLHFVKQVLLSPLLLLAAGLWMRLRARTIALKLYKDPDSSVD